MKKPNFTRIDTLILIIILMAAFAFRLYKIDSPLADLHSWRQADTAAVARNFARDGIHLMLPKYDDLSSIETGKDNPEGYRMVEFPIYNAMIAVVYKLAPFLTLEVAGRLVTVFFSLVIVSIIYYLLLKEGGRLAATAAAFTYAIFPFFVFFSRVILPETTALGFTFISILLMYLYTHKNLGRGAGILVFLLSSLFFAGAILIKPTTIFYGITLAFLLLDKYKFTTYKKVEPYILAAITLAPFALWRMYIKNYPEGIPASDWLLTSVNTYEGLKTVFLRPAFFRWIFFERIGEMIFGAYLLFFFLLGIVKRNTKLLFHSLLLSALVYLFVFEGGNVQHEYYQTIILPPLAIFTGIGVGFLWSLRKNLLPSGLLIGAVVTIAGASFLFSYYKIKDFYNVPSDLTGIARVIQTLTKPEDRIVTDRSGDSTLLYLADRKGWPASGNLDELKSKGYSYFVTANTDVITDLREEKKFREIFSNNHFTIFAL